MLITFLQQPRAETRCGPLRLLCACSAPAANVEALALVAPLAPRPLVCGER